MTPRRKGTRKMVTTGAITSRKLAMVSPTAELVYWRAYMACDNYGTMSADPWDVLQAALPGKNGITEDVVRQAIAELVDAGLLERWIETDGEAWMHMLGHDLHQQSSWLGRRGARRSPIPPSLRIENDEYRAGFDPVNDEPTPAPASERTLSSPDAGSVPMQVVACSPTTTPTTTPTSNTPPPPMVEDGVADAVGYLPEAVDRACRDAAATGPRAEWWVSSVQKLRKRYASAADEVFVGALDWIIVEADGAHLGSSRAWAMLEAAVRKRATDLSTTPSVVRAAPKRRLLTDVIAQHEASWETAS